MSADPEMQRLRSASFNVVLSLRGAIYDHNSDRASPQTDCAMPIAPTLIRKAMRTFTPLLSSQSWPVSMRRLSWPST